MERLIAKRPVLYQGRQYEAGEALPAHDTAMVAAWLRAGSAAMMGGAAPEEPEPSGNDGQNAQNEPESGGNATEGNNTQDTAEGHLDAVQLSEMSKDDLVALAKEMGVELPRGAAKALIVEKLAGVTVQAPTNDGSAQ